jgi:sulfonate transport system substrate-binding protein
MNPTDRSPIDRSLTGRPILPRRRLLQSSMLALAAAAAWAPGGAQGRTTDTVRLTWGYGGLTLVAKERGLFADRLAQQGIKVEWLGPFPNHAPTMQAVVGNSADFSFGGSTTPALAALIAGAPLVFAQFLVYEPRTTAIIAKDGSGIDRVEDLVGRSVAVNRSGLGEFLLVAALEKHKVDRAKVRFVYLNPPDAGPALAAGKVDAWAMWSPGVDIARADYKAHDIFIEGRDLDFQIDYTSFLVRQRFAKDNPDLIRAVIGSLQQEAAWTNDNPLETEQILQRAAKYDDAIRDQFVRMHRRYTFHPPSDGQFVQQLQQAADWLTARKVLPEHITVSDYLATPSA